MSTTDTKDPEEETKSMENLTLEGNNDPEMSLDERMDWLRERGVLVETAEERKRKQVVAAMNQANVLQSNEPVYYVLIPSDTSKPLQQLSFHPIKNVGGDQLIDHVQPEFSKKDDELIDIELLRQQQSQTTLAAAMGDGDGTLPSVSDSTIRKVSEQANVETFTVVHPTPQNNYTSVVMYLDEIGMMKHLPLNTRASDYCYRAGFNPAPIFYGNVYIGRIQQRPKLHNISFVLGPDTSFDAPWLQSAVSSNLRYQQELNKITGQGDVRQASVAGSDGNVQNEDGFQWTQTEQEIELQVLLPNEALSKHVSVKFHPQTLTVLYQKDPKLSLSLFERIDCDACTWTLESTSADTGPGKKLTITMEKLEEAYWPRIRD